MDYKSGAELKPGGAGSQPSHAEHSSDSLNEDGTRTGPEAGAGSEPGPGDEYIKNQINEADDEEEFNNNILNL